MIVLRERLSVLFMKWEWTHGWLLLRRWIDDDLYDRYEWFECVCVCVFIHNEREREREIYIGIEWRVIENDYQLELINEWMTFNLFQKPQILFFLLSSLSLSLFLASTSPTSPYILLPHRNFYISLMLSILMIMGVIVLIVVSGDDTQALRDTISSLCSLNKVGQFASCCGSYDNGASITLEWSKARECFISGLVSTTGSVLTYLFVICFILFCSFFLMIVIVFLHFSFSGVLISEGFLF